MKKSDLLYSIVFVLALGMLTPAMAVGGGTPGTPFDPHVTNRTATTITIQWDVPLANPQFVTWYEVRYSGDEGATWTAFSEANKSDTTAVISSFQPGVNYVVNVASIGTGGQSNWVSVSKPENTTATSFSVGNMHTCTALATREIKCWGSNSAGQLGNNTTANSNVPVTVTGITNATSISAGSEHTCATLATGEIKCWGDNGFGKLGNGTTTDSNVPVTVTGITNATSVSNLSAHTCATLATGELKCWGYNSGGQLGNNTTANSNVPVTVTGITNATTVSVGNMHTCTALATGEIKCWGSNSAGQLGNNTTANSYVPVTVTGITNATSVSAGSEHTCATLATGEIKCWGYNSGGQLGNNTTANSNVPVTVTGITNATTVSADIKHTCTALATGEIKCWGSNNAGQLGNGTTSDSAVPVTAANYFGNFFWLPRRPMPPSTVTLASKTSNSLTISWSNNSDADGLSIDNYSVEISTDQVTWTSYETTQTTKTFSNLQPASILCATVNAHSDAGWGSRSEIFCSETTGTRTIRFNFEQESGGTVSGGSVQWRLIDNSFVGAQPLGITSNGVLEFPRVAAGLGIITASNLVMGDGTLVSGSWVLKLGYATHTLRVPEAPSVAQRTVRVVLPNGLPVAGAMVSVAVNSITTSDAFTFRASAPKEGGTTDAKGEFVAVGYSNGNPTATISYNDGVLIQNKTVTLTSEITEVTLDEMPWLELASSSTTAVENALVPIAIKVGAVAPLAAYRALGMDPYAMSGISVSVVPPKGSVQKCAKKVLSAKTNVSGRATLKVCATKSGVYTIKGRGAAATGAFTLKVKGAAPMPVTSLSGITPAAATAKIAWNAPTYTGGAPVKNYTVTIVGGGKIFKKVVTTRTVTFTGLKRATVYTATVVAMTKNGTSDKATTSVSVA